jgi:predicted enzyme related to lactoylglutathione lyase
MANNHINYIEFKAKDLVETKEFYTKAFNWSFTDYGPDYIAFSEAGIDGGFEHSTDEILNGTLIVLYHDDLIKIKDQIIQAKGTISKDIFSFPGGQRFHFIDPSGNELAVWSDK